MCDDGAALQGKPFRGAIFPFSMQCAEIASATHWLCQVNALDSPMQRTG